MLDRLRCESAVVAADLTRKAKEPERLPVTAVILAGGFGTRLRSLCPHLPKPMIPVAGRPFLDWVLLYLRSQGIDRAIVSSGHLGETVETHCRQNPVAGLRVSTVKEENPLGTAGGFLAAAAVDSEADAFLVCNGDSLALAPLAGFWADFHANGAAASILAISVHDARRFGTLEVDSAGWLAAFREKQPGAGLINAGIYLIGRSSLALFPKRTPLSFEMDVFPRLLAGQRRVRAYQCDAPFLDIGTPESVAAAPRFVTQHLAQLGA